MKITEIIQEGDKWADAQGLGITIGSDGRYHVPSSTMRKINAMSNAERAKISKNNLQAYNQQKERDGIPQVAQLTMPPKQKTILDPNRAGLNIADISKPKPDPMQVARPEPPVAKPKPTMPMGGIAGVIRRKKQK